MSDFDLAGPLGRARRVLQETPEPGWPATEQRVIAAVRATHRGGWPLSVVDPEPDRAPGTIAVTDLALKGVLFHVLRVDPDYAVSGIDVVADETTVRTVRIELTGRYGADLNAAARRAVERTTLALEEVIGVATGIPIDVAVTDVHR